MDQSQFSVGSLNIADLPNDILIHIFSFVSAEDHLSISSVCQKLHSLYFGENSEKFWQRLSFQYFPHESQLRVHSLPQQKQRSLCNPYPHPLLPHCHSQDWHSMFRDCTQILSGLKNGSFYRSRVWEHPISPTPLLVDYQVFHVSGYHIFMERNVGFNGTTRFLFRCLSDFDFHFEWKIKIRSLFPDFSPMYNRKHCDIRVKNGVLALIFYSTNGNVERLYSWSVHTLQDLRGLLKMPLESYWKPELISSQISQKEDIDEYEEHRSLLSSSLETQISSSSTEQQEQIRATVDDQSEQSSQQQQQQQQQVEDLKMKLVGIQPPFIALQGEKCFILVNFLTNKIVFLEDCSDNNKSIEACRWDSRWLVFIAQHKTGQFLHIIALKELAHNISSIEMNNNFSDLDYMESTTTVSAINNFQPIIIPCEHKLSGGYLDFFHCTSGLVIFASTITRTFCKISVGTRFSGGGPIRQSLFIIEQESNNSSDGVESFSTPKGIFFGDSGPFLTFSDGCEIYWCVDQGPNSPPFARKIRVGMGKSCSGHHQVVILGSNLLQICSKHDEHKREVSLYEPCSTQFRSVCQYSPVRIKLNDEVEDNNNQ